MKKAKIVYWTATIFIFLFEGVMPALTSQTALAKEGIRNLGYPEYFGSVLVVFKILGVLALIIPLVPDRIKQWAYAGFAFIFIFAFISYAIVNGFSGLAFFPLVIFAVLIASYLSYEKLKKHKSGIGLTYQSGKNALSAIG